MAINKLRSPDMKTQFSDLPHHIIFGKILHPTKVAVQMSFILSKQYWDEDVVSSTVSLLDFDQDDDLARHNVECKRQGRRQHTKFIRFLEGYLEHYHEKGHKCLDRLRLKMRKCSSTRDVTILGRWLEIAFERGVKELDISFRILGTIRMTSFANSKTLTSLKLEYVRFTSFASACSETEDPHLLLPCLKSMSLKAVQFDDNDAVCDFLEACPSIEHLSLIEFEHNGFILPTCTLKSIELMYCVKLIHHGLRNRQADILESFTLVGGISWTWPDFPYRRSLTRLKLQYVKILGIPGVNGSDGCLFPCLKSMCFKSIPELDDEALLSVVSAGCPSLEYISLTECCFTNFKCYLSSSTLKSLKVEHCSQLRVLQVDEANNLESFTFLSLPQSDSKCDKVILNNFPPLKNINISVEDRVEFFLNGCRYEWGPGEITRTRSKT